MTKTHKKFQGSVLRFYDFYIEFEGDSPNHVERPAVKDSTENFAAWKKRVLGTGVSDVRVYRPVDVDGRTKISTIADEGRALKLLIRQSTAKVKTVGREQLQAAEDKALRQTQEFEKKSRKTVTDVKNKAARKIEETRQTFYRKAMQVPIDELRQIIEDVGESLEPAVKEHIEKLVTKASKDEFPLRALLREMIETQAVAVQVVRSRNNV